MCSLGERIRLLISEIFEVKTDLALFSNRNFSLVVHLLFFCIEVNFQRIFKCETNYVSMCKYNNYKFLDLTFFEGINKYNLRKPSVNELTAVFSVSIRILNNI